MIKLALRKTTVIHNLIFTYRELTSLLLWQRFTDIKSLPPVCTVSYSSQPPLWLEIITWWSSSQWIVRSNVHCSGPKSILIVSSIYFSLWLSSVEMISKDTLEAIKLAYLYHLVSLNDCRMIVLHIHSPNRYY